MAQDHSPIPRVPSDLMRPLILVYFAYIYTHHHHMSHTVSRQHSSKGMAILTVLILDIRAFLPCDSKSGIIRYGIIKSRFHQNQFAKIKI